jgi:uncharacterized protein YdeI (YjbR/CyaY-like superfamily)
MSKKEVDIFYPENKKQWRQWLEENHGLLNEVWLVFYKKASGKPSVTWSDSVDEALCFGWIDSKKVPVDAEKSHQFFSKRKPKSTWSKINKDKTERLIKEGLMAPAGFESIRIAKDNESWTLLDEVEALIIPDDLEMAFNLKPGSKEYFLSLSKSMRKMILQWVVLAKLPDTRRKRINEIAEHAQNKQKPKHL